MLDYFVIYVIIVVTWVVTEKNGMDV
jgi:hypothetical protein